MFQFHRDCTPTPCEPGVTRRILAYSREVMLCEILFEAGARGSVHSHPHTQATYVAEGVFEFTVCGETRTVRAGDSVLMPPDSVHGVACLEAGKLIDVFTPMREDFL